MTENPLEIKINEIIAEVEQGLLNGNMGTQNPETALEYQTKLTALRLTSYGLIERLDTLEAQHAVDKRENFKSDAACKKAWKISHEGQRQSFWELRIKRIKVLTDTLNKLYDQARDERKYIDFLNKQK